MAMSKRQQLDNFRKSLENERSTFVPHWRDLNDYFLPRRGRFFLDDVNRGERRNQKIIDLTGPKAARTLRSGMMSGLTSPARPWFNLKTQDPDLMDYPSVKQWLYVVKERMASFFLNSNFYQQLPIIYGDLGVFGTAALLFEKDKDKVIRTKAIPIGSYSICTDFSGKVNGFTRELKMTVQQCVDTFGMRKENNGSADWSVFSDYVKSAYDNSNYNQWVSVAHIIQENQEFDPTKMAAKYKQYSDCYYEIGKGYDYSDDAKYLRESGYDLFPVLAPRWETTGEDYYGTDCPGMMSLGDNKALQIMHKRSAQAIEKQVNPPMVAPTQMQSVKSSILPADITYFDETNDKKFRQVHDVNFNLTHLDKYTFETQQRIRQAFFEDIMLMFAESDRRQITAAEVEERGAEKFLVLGPVLSNVNSDLLDPAVAGMFQYMEQLGHLPPAPPELENMDLGVEYVSVMAQAQKLVGLDSVNKFLGVMGNVAQFDPKILRKINSYEIANVVADITSVPPKLLYSDDEAYAAEQQAQQAMQQQQQAEMQEKQASAAQKLGSTPVEGDNALGKLLGM